METTLLTEQLVYDVVDYWMDESHSKYVGWKLLHNLKTATSEVHATLDNRTLVINLFSVILETILKYEFRNTFAQIFNILLCTSHHNTMFLFDYITSTRSGLIGAIVQMSLDLDDAVLLKSFTEVRRIASKSEKFRTEHCDVNKTPYAEMAHRKVGLYRQYMSKETVNTDVCIVVVNDLFETMCGQPTLKDTFCEKNGWARLLDMMHYASTKASGSQLRIFEGCCKVASILVENYEQNGPRLLPTQISVLLDIVCAILVTIKDYSLVVEVATSVLCKTVKIVHASDGKVIDGHKISGIVNEVTSIHNENIIINQNCAILMIIMSDEGRDSTGRGELSSGARCRSGGGKTRSVSSSRKSRIQARREKTVAPSRTGGAGPSLAENRPSKAMSYHPFRTVADG